VPPAFEADRRVHAAPARERVPARLDAAQLVPLETALRPPPDDRAGPADAAA
jgi:hypothetical protein